MRGTLNAIHKCRVAHKQQESKEKLQQALKHKIRMRRVECAEVGDQVYYKKDKEGEWRGPGKVIGRDGKVVVVKHGGNVREVTRVHITRLKGTSNEENEEEEEEEELDGRSDEADEEWEGVVMQRRPKRKG